MSRGHGEDSGFRSHESLTLKVLKVPLADQPCSMGSLNLER